MERSTGEVGGDLTNFISVADRKVSLYTYDSVLFSFFSMTILVY